MGGVPKLLSKEAFLGDSSWHRLHDIVDERGDVLPQLKMGS